MNYLIQLVQDISLRICTEVLCRSLLAVEFNPKDHYVDAVEFYSKVEGRLSLLYFFLISGPRICFLKKSDLSYFLNKNGKKKREKEIHT